MATEVIQKANSEFAALKAEMEGHRENPRLIRLVTALVRLTNSPAQNEEMDKAESNAPDPKAEERARLQAQQAAIQKQLENLG